MKPNLMIEVLEGRRLFAATLDPASPGAQPILDDGGGLVSVTAETTAKIRAAANEGQNLADGMIQLSRDGGTNYAWVKKSDVVYTRDGLKLASDVTTSVTADEGLRPQSKAISSGSEEDATPLPYTGGGLIKRDDESIARAFATPNEGQNLADGLIQLSRDGGSTYSWVKRTDVVYTRDGLKLASDLEEDFKGILG